MSRTLVSALLLLLAQPGQAAVEAFDQLVNVESTASSRCLEDEEPEADFQKLWIDVVGDVEDSIRSTMSSDCGEAEMRGGLRISFQDDAVTGSFFATSLADSLGGGYANLNSYVQFRAGSATGWTLTASGTTTGLGDPDLGGLQIGFAGIESGILDEIGIEWSGTLAAGQVAVLSLHASSLRDFRILQGDVILLREGETGRRVNFRLEFDGPVTPALPVSTGRLKSNY